MKTTPQSELAARGFAEPAKTLASIEQGLTESAAGLAAPRKRRRRAHGTGALARIAAAQVGEVLWLDFSRTEITAGAIQAGKTIEQTTCWAVEARGGKTHKVIRVEIKP